MTISILTIFPQMVIDTFNYGVVGRGQKTGRLQIKAVDLREFTLDKHRSVDGKPFGGGPGMVGRVDIFDRAITNVKLQIANSNPQAKTKIVLLSPQGRRFDQKVAEEYSKLDHLILISGRYGGVDERVAEHLVDEELSIGGYVLSGGEIPALVVADAVARLVPGVLGAEDSLVSETCESRFDYPAYTEPVEYKGWRVPEILRSGDHEKIKDWREQAAKAKRERQRPEI